MSTSSTSNIGNFNKINASPPSATKSRSNSASSTVQHDQIPINSSFATHSSASYKQELMDSSVLLDNINDLLSIWDNHQQNTHSLQPTTTNNQQSSLNSFLFSPSISSTNNINSNKPLISTTNINKYRLQTTKTTKTTKTTSPSTSITTTMAGPHQTYYIKDDTTIKHKNKSSHSKSSKHDRHRNHHHNISRTPINIRNIEDIPLFVAHNDRRLNLLGEMIELKRLELERISQRHDYTLQCIIKLYMTARSNIVFLRKQHRYLSSFAEQLSREGQIRNKLSDCILNTLHNIEEQRKNLLNVIESPSWEIKHHFHILSFEHFRGNQQPHLLEIAEVLPSRLQIAAISHSSTIKNDKLLKQFNIAQKERDLLYKKLSQIDKKRNLTQCHLKDYKKMMQIIKKNIGEKRLNKLKNEQQEKEKNKKKNIMKIKQQKKPIKQQKYLLNHEWRTQYLSGIGIRKSKKIKFNLIEFVIQINKFLNISKKETKKELKELKNNTDLINPITGQINNPSFNIKEENDEKEKKEKDIIIHHDDEEEIEEKEKHKKTIKHKYKLKEKPLRENILNIIDKNKYILKQEKTDKNINIFSVELIEEKQDIKMDDDDDDDVDIDDDDDDDSDDIDIDIDIIDITDINDITDITDIVDAPHRDWSVLAKHLKDSSKEQARRKQILKQLERILHVREGLIVGFDQLKQIYNNYQNKIILAKKR